MLVAALFASSTLALSTSCFETLSAFESAFSILGLRARLEQRHDPGASPGKVIRDLVLDLLPVVMGDKPAHTRADAGANDTRGKECGREDEAHEQAAGRTQERPDSDAVRVVLDVENLRGR